MKKVASALLLLCFAVPCFGSTCKSGWKEIPNWDNYFEREKVQGCFLLYDLQRNEYMSYNRKRVETPN